MRGSSLVVFDLDGTLVDSIRDIAAAVNEALARVAPATPPLDLAQIQASVGDGARVLMARSLEKAGLASPVDEVVPLYLETYARRMLDTSALYPGVEQALEALRGHTLCVLTNKAGDLSRALLAGLGAAPHFSRIWGAGDVPARKPDPAGLRRLMGELRTGPDETVMVGDSPVDVATGRAAGVRTVGVSYGFDPRGLAASLPDAMVDDLRELPSLLQRFRAP